MSISTKPQDSDAIIEKRIDALGNEQFVATNLLITFFDDIVNLLNLSEPSQSEAQNLAVELQVKTQRNFLDLVDRIQSLKERAELSLPNLTRLNHQEGRLQELESKQQSIYQLLLTPKNAAEIDGVKNSLDSLQNTFALLNQNLAALLVTIEGLESRISNLEQTAWQ